MYVLKCPAYENGDVAGTAVASQAQLFVRDTTYHVQHPFSAPQAIRGGHAPRNNQQQDACWAQHVAMKLSLLD